MDYQTVLWLIPWILVGGLVGTAIGRAKGRPEAGAAWGAFLGVLGWAVIAAGPDRRPKCPECQGVVVQGARRCKNCGVALPPTPSLDDALACEVCGKQLRWLHAKLGGARRCSEHINTSDA